MVEFPYEEIDDPLTTGLGTFLLEDTSQYSLDTTLLCTGFKVDPPPHNQSYFNNQITAIRNYYNSVSNGIVDFDYSVLEATYKVRFPMRDYSIDDKMLATFFNESIELAKDDIIETGLDLDDVLLVVFHAGMGQDFSVPFIDPTNHDLKSAYVDDKMFDGNYIEISGIEVTRGLILPETQNMLYYDVVQDIFPSTEDLCDIQVGLTGTFALLMGYALEIPPLFNTETGMPGVGVFGLMDHGSNNGRGVIPAPPTAWTRIQQGWATEIIIKGSGNYTISSRDQKEQIYRIDISRNEYFLIENRNNWIFENVDIDSLRRKQENKISDNQIGHWFTTLINELEGGVSNQFTKNGDVFTGFKNYDYGLPGSGLLIWHIREPEGDLLFGINNDLDDRAIQLEEADGAIDIGYSNLLPFIWDDHVNGWGLDLWYLGNPDYNVVNSFTVDNNEMLFDKDTRPNTDATDGSKSNIRINILSKASDEMTFSVNFGTDPEYEKELLSENKITILGNGQIDGFGNIFYAYDNKLFKKNLNEIELFSLESFNSVLCAENSCEFLVEDKELAITYIEPIVGLSTSQEYFSIGNLISIDKVDTLLLKTSLGDIDGDGLDELVFISNNSIIVENYSNNTDLNGFPVQGNFTGEPLIADIIDVEDEYPEIICREGNHITILSHKGERLKEIPAFSDQQIAIVPNWKVGIAAIIDGAQLLLFEFDEDDSYWLNEFSQSSNYPQSTGNHKTKASFRSMDELSVYNYPNPIRDKGTRFRFFVVDENSASVKIYDMMGLHIITINNSMPWVQNEFNEIEWIPSPEIQAGIYFAEIILDSGKSQLVKVVLIR